MRRFIHNLWRWLVFKVGDTRWIGWRHFPFILTWDVHEHLIDGYEAAEAMKVLQKGDVIVLRHEGFASNVGLGGAMVHAALYIGNHEVVEALSDDQGGVCRRHVSDTLRADYVLILRPPVTRYAIDDAIEEALNIVGFKYDIFFDFNTEEERALIKANRDAALKSVRFCCTEVPFYAYHKNLPVMDIYRERNPSFFAKILSLVGLHMGKQVVTADMFAASAMKVVWASKHATPNWFKSMGCSEKQFSRVLDYYKRGTSR